MICVYESVSLVYIHNVIDRNANRELHSAHDWKLLKAAVEENRLQVTSNGQWIPNQEVALRITLTPQGRAQLLSRELASPSDRGMYLFDVFLSIPRRQLALHAPATVNEEDKAFLTEVVVSAEKGIAGSSRGNKG